MRHPKGFIPIIIVAFISVLAITMVGVSWYYKEHKTPYSSKQVGHSPTTNIQMTDAQKNTIVEKYSPCEVYFASPTSGTIYNVDGGCMPGSEARMTDLGVNYFNARSEKITNCNGFFVEDEDTSLCDWLERLNYTAATSSATNTNTTLNTNESVSDIQTNTEEIISEVTSTNAINSALESNTSSSKIKTSFNIDDFIYPDDWTTLINEQYGFSVKYPRKYVAHSTNYDVSFNDVPKAYPGLSVGYFNSNSWIMQKDTEISEWVISQYLHGDQYNEYKGTATINGVPAAHVSSTGPSGVTEEYLVNHNGQMFRVGASHFPEDQKENEWILEAFFSSFQFTK